MELATLVRVKAMLGIAESDTSRDVDLQTTINAVNAHVLRVTRLRLTAGSITSEIHRNIRRGKTITSGVRPIDGLVTLERFSGGLWEALDNSVVDADTGLIMVGADFTRPPSYLSSVRYPLVRAGYAYSATVLASIADLVEAADLLSAEWDRTGTPVGQGPVVSESAGAVSVSYGAYLSFDRKVSYPPAVGRILSSYLPGAMLAG